jgi:Pentose-5-phosphate-3-epimerase
MHLTGWPLCAQPHARGAHRRRSAQAHPSADLDCHLMVTAPDQWVGDYAKAGASGLTFHLETQVCGWDEARQEADVAKATAMAQSVRDAGMRPGVALKPATPVQACFPLVDAGAVDMVLIMTVEPGFGGQKFMAECLSKVTALRQRYPSLDIQVDGGLSPSTIDAAAAAGANVIVAGSSVFGAPDPKAAIEALRQGVVKASTRSA